jgi:predicted nucleic acid-binding protein
VTAVVVAEASPLIALQQIGELRLLRAVFTELIVPPAVPQEILPSVPTVVPEMGMTIPEMGTTSSKPRAGLAGP